MIEVIEYTNFIQKLAKYEFQPGYSKDLMACRLTLDPVFATQRPFFFYAVISSVNISTHAIIYYLGFRKRQNFCLPAQNVYYRPGTGSENGIPIIFAHGIGIGFAHYMSLIALLPKDVDVYLIEWPHVAMQLNSNAPSSLECVTILLSMLNNDNNEKICFVAHSLGTTLISWFMHHPIGITKIASTVILDPVVFLLCDPTVATSFVYKDPVTTIDFLMHFFVSRELFIANALSRHFSWSENILFIDDLTENSRLNHPNNIHIMDNNNHRNNLSNEDNDIFIDDIKVDNVTESIIDHTVSCFHLSNMNFYFFFLYLSQIIISTRDSIIPVAPILRYFKAKQDEGHNTFELVLFDGLHGEFFLSPTKVMKIVDKIRIRCRLSKQ